MLAIIPARGGSKGLLKKNIKLLNGIPLIAHSILQAYRSKYISRIFVSTDCPEILKIAQNWCAECPSLRPQELATDTSIAIKTYQYLIQQFQLTENKSYESFVVLQPTSPLRRALDIDAAITLFNTKDADSVISYSEDKKPLAWSKFLSSEGKFIHQEAQQYVNNRQTFPTSYHPNGSIYVFKTDLIFRETYYGDNSYAYIMPTKYSVDIDTLDDFLFAEYCLNKR